MKILVADDEKDIADALGMILKYSGYDKDVVYDGEEAIKMAQTHVYDAMILDIMMPKASGIDVLKRLREADDMTPVLLLTAKAEVEDRILGLEMGADDYLPKPFDRGELLARLKTMLRRANVYDTDILVRGNTTLFCERLELVRGSNALRLTTREVEVLAFLMRHMNKEVPGQMLIEKCWRDEAYEEGALTLYLGYLKNKLKSVHSDLVIQNTEYGVILTAGGENV